MLRGMRRVGVILLAATIQAGADDALRFLNRDTLRGTLVQATPGEGLQFRHPHAATPIAFDLGKLAELQLGPRPPRGSRMLHSMTVELTNDDRWTGEVVALDDQALTLDTWYAGRVRLARPMVRRVDCRVAMPGAWYAGPTSLAEWGSPDNRNAWSYRGGKLYSTFGQYGSIYRDMKLPARVNVEFDLAWRGQFYANVGLYCNGVGQGYMLQLQNEYAHLRRASPGRHDNLGNSVPLPGLRQKSAVRVGLRGDVAKKTITLYLDGKLAHQWTDPNAEALAGPGLMFMSQGQGQLRIGAISVTEWDGRLDSEVPEGNTSSEDLVVLRNQDKVSGQITGIDGQTLALTNSFAAVKIPLERVAAVALAATTSARPRRQAADVRAFFPDRTQITVALETLDDRGLTGTSETCGKLTVPLDAITRLQFQPYTPATKADEDDWPAGKSGNSN